MSRNFIKTEYQSENLSNHGSVLLDYMGSDTSAQAVAPSTKTTQKAYYPHADALSRAGLIEENADAHGTKNENEDYIEEWSNGITEPIVLSYLKDISRTPLLSLDEEHHIMRQIGAIEKRAITTLFELPQAINELSELGRRLHEGAVNILDVTNCGDKIGCGDNDMESFKTETISSIHSAERLHKRAEEIRDQLSKGYMFQAEQCLDELQNTEHAKEKVLLNLRLNKKSLLRIVRKSSRRMKYMSADEADTTQDILQELVKIDEELRFIRNRLVKANLRLVFTVAGKYRNRGVPFADLIQEGNIGLMKATERYDHEKGYRFSTYALWWIRQAMMRAIADHGQTIRVPVHAFEMRKKIRKISEALSRELEREAQIHEIASKIGFSTEKIRNIMAFPDGTVSIETPLGDSDYRLADSITDSEALSPLEEMVNSSLRDEIDEVLSTLTHKEEQVMRMRLGIGCDECTLDEVGTVFKLSRERIRQIEAKALKRLKHPTRRRKLESFVNA